LNPEQQTDSPGGECVTSPPGWFFLYLKLWLPGVALIALHLLVAWISSDFEYGADPLPRPIPFFVGIEVLAGAIYLFAAWNARNAPEGKKTLAWIIVFGLGMRAILFGSTPVQEDDFYRYLWDGAVTASAINPYSYSPQEALQANVEAKSALSKLHGLAEQSGVVASRVNHPHLRTIYPPVAQGAFAMAYWLKPWSIMAWRTVLLLFDIAALCILLLILRALGLPLAFALIYWWNPLLIKESFNSAHMDMVLVPFVLGGLLLAIRNKHLWGTAALTLAMGVKLWPIVLSPFILRPLTAQPKRLAAAICIIAILGAALFVPVYSGGLDGDSGFTAYGKRWEMNDALFMLFVWGSKYSLQAIGIEDANGKFSARIIAALLLCIWIGILARGKIEGGLDLCEKCMLTVAALFLLSPTQFPWYYIWLLPLLAIRPRASLLLLTALLPLYYLRFYYSPRGNVAFFDYYIVWVEFVPVWCLLIWEFCRSRRRLPALVRQAT
jgi:hypothetical protein